MSVENKDNEKKEIKIQQYTSTPIPAWLIVFLFLSVLAAILGFLYFLL